MSEQLPEPLPPLPDDVKAAIREARFCTLNLAHTQAIICVDEAEHAFRISVNGGTKITRSREPLVYEYDIVLAHPEAIELVAEIQAARS